MKLLLIITFSLFISFSYAKSYSGDEAKADSTSKKSSITTAEEIQIKVMPNPANDYFAVETGSVKIIEVSLSDFSGNILFTDNVPIKGKTIFSIDGYPAGTYILKLKSQEKEYTRKLNIFR